MPGFFEGGTPGPADALRILRQLSGQDELDDGERAAADLNGDQRLGADDALTLLRATQQPGLLSASPPSLSRATPAICRPGDPVSLQGAALAANSTTPSVYLLSEDGTEWERSVTVQSNELVTFDLPSDIPVGSAGIRVLRDGILSEQVSISIIGGPVLYDAVPPFAAAGSVISLRGAGFGIDPGAVSVSFGDASVTPNSVNDDAIDVTVPASLSGVVPLQVDRSGVLSNPLSFATAIGLQGSIVLPGGSPVSPQQLTVFSNQGDSAAVDGNAAFSLSVPHSFPLQLEAQDDAHDIVWAASLAGTNDNATLDADSSALWLVLLASSAYLLTLEQQAALRAAMIGSAQLPALRDALLAGHAAQPKLLELVETPAVAPVHQAAVAHASAQIQILQLAGG